MLKVINPLQLENTKNEQLLHELLTKFKNCQAWKKGEIYWVFHQNITLTHSIFLKKSTNTNRHYHIIANTMIEEGGYSEVYDIENSFSFTLDIKINYLPTKPLVVKIQNKRFDLRESSTNFKIRIDKEYRSSQTTKHLHIEPPVFFEDSSYLVMHKMPGIDLDRFFEMICKHTLPVKFLLELTIAILNAFKEQVVDLEISHRDIKPDNMILNTGEHASVYTKQDWQRFSPKQIEVNIVDYAFSLKFKEKSSKLSGTVGYFSPELMFHKQFNDEKPDLYAIGIIIQRLWGFYPYFVKNIKDGDGNKYINKITIEEIYNNLFVAQKENFPIDTLIKICIITAHMVKASPKERWSLQQSISAFELLLKQLMMQINSKLINANIKVQRPPVIRSVQYGLKNPSGALSLLNKYESRANTIPFYSKNPSDIKLALYPLWILAQSIWNIPTRFIHLISAFYSMIEGFTNYTIKMIVNHRNPSPPKIKSPPIIYKHFSKTLVSFSEFDKTFKSQISGEIEEMKRAMFAAKPTSGLKNRAGNIVFWSGSNKCNTNHLSVNQMRYK
jgi:serine/threonine protein kinase